MKISDENEIKIRKLLTIGSRAFSLLLLELEKDRSKLQTYKDAITFLNIVEELKMEFNKIDRNSSSKFTQTKIKFENLY